MLVGPLRSYAVTARCQTCVSSGVAPSSGREAASAPISVDVEAEAEVEVEAKVEADVEVSSGRSCRSTAVGSAGTGVSALNHTVASGGTVISAE